MNWRLYTAYDGLRGLYGLPPCLAYRRERFGCRNGEASLSGQLRPPFGIR